MSPRATAAVIAVVGAAIGLAGDACHVAAGLNQYDVAGVPTVWRSALWFPFAVGLAVLAAAWGSDRLGLPAHRARTRGDVPAGAAAVLALYALTAVLRHQPTTVSVVLTGALAVLVWAWWDPSPGALLTALVAAVLGPLAEIAVSAAGLAHYASDVDGLGGVPPWLPCLYFAAGAVASRLWAAVERS
ncbi:MAG TPA: hypothetical protein VMZ11_06135 [Mycobacteriales bacterium]|nr:hypothetical protein [Mycobacteriales bacterium]